MTQVALQGTIVPARPNTPAMAAEKIEQAKGCNLLGVWWDHKRRKSTKRGRILERISKGIIESARNVVAASHEKMNNSVQRDWHHLQVRHENCEACRPSGISFASIAEALFTRGPFRLAIDALTVRSVPLTASTVQFPLPGSSL